MAGWTARRGDELQGDEAPPAEILNLERLQDLARTLASSLKARLRRHPRPRHLIRLHRDLEALREAYRALADDVRRGEPLAPAAEWLLDNFHLIETEGRQIPRDLPPSYYRKLPRLDMPPRSPLARIEAMALELIRHSDARVDVVRLKGFLSAYQTVAPLTIGELWAWPTALKLALLRSLRRLADS